MQSLLYPRLCPVCGNILPEHVIKRDAFREDENAEMQQNPDRGMREGCLSGISGAARTILRMENPYICPKCYPYLNFPPEPRCLRCSRPIRDEMQEYCRECAGKKKYFDQGIALLMHDKVAEKILYDLKFSNKRDHADMLAYEAAGRCCRRLAFWDPEVIVPVPLHKKKERQRGFNQSLLLARKLSLYLKEQGLDIPVRSDLLERIRETKPMKTLDHAGRMQNIQGAFQVRDLRGDASGVKDGYKRILLIDDIYTSGATLSECAKVLKKSGVQEVYFLTFSIG